jgi:DNA adenine methylase
MRKERSYAEVYNDQWSEVCNVFRVLRDSAQAERLEQLLRLTPFARDEFAQTSYAQVAQCDDIERARRTIFRSMAGFGSASVNGAYATGFRANSNKSGTTPAHDWAHYPDQIKGFTERLQGVCIENRPAISVIEQHDAEQTLFYVDPPYPHTTRNMARGNAAYACEMTDDDHRELAQTLHAVRGMVVLSGYACDLYDKELFADWFRCEREHFADGARPRTEVLWLNETCISALRREERQQGLELA